MECRECGCSKPGVGEHTFPGLLPCRGPGVQPRVAFGTALPLATIPRYTGRRHKRQTDGQTVTIYRTQGDCGRVDSALRPGRSEQVEGLGFTRRGNSPSCLISESTVPFREMHRGEREVVASVAR